MKGSILIITALIVLSPMVIWAQPAEEGQPSQDKQGEFRGRGPGRDGPGPGIRLNLSEEQREKMQALRKEFRPKFQEAVKSGDKDKVKAVEDEFIAKAKTFLDEKQVEKLQARHKAMARRWKHRREQMGPKLDLTDEQKAKMKELRQKHQAEMKAIREKHQADMKKILTPEQAEKWEAWRKKKQEQMKDRPMGPRGKHDRGHRGKGSGKKGDGPKGTGPCGENAPCPSDKE